MNRDQKGTDATLIVAGQAIPVTEKEWTENRDIANDQWDDSINPNKSIATQEAEGTITYAGSQAEFQNIVRDDQGKPIGDLRLVIREDGADHDGFRFNGVEFSSIGKNYPSDDTNEVDADWEAEEIVPL
jgi:hypothetical protein